MLYKENIMNTPLIIFNNIFPREIISIIQLYLTNDAVKEPIREYIRYIYRESELYEEFVLSNYVFPECRCNWFPDNGLSKIYKRKDCGVCWYFESGGWSLDRYNVCVSENSQLDKICGI
jgi:hypothetical protein